jgi:hypothetical protein
MEVGLMGARKTVRLIFSILGLAGVLAMLFGVVVWNIYESFATPLAFLPVVIGGGLFVVFLAVNIPIIIVEGRQQKALVGLNVFVMIVIGTFILLVVNYLGFKHFRTFDLTAVKIYSLSDLTTKTLGGLEHDIKAYVFFQPTSLGYDYVKRGLTQYERASDKIAVEYVDIERDKARAEKIIKEKIRFAAPDTVVFFEEDSGRSREVKMDEIFDVENYGPFSNIPPRINRYKGEEAFTAAIINVTAEKQFKIYFLKGHGERDPESFKEDAGGYGPVVDSLKRLGYRVGTLNLAVDERIPKDCDILVIAGPAKPFLSVEVKILDRYLEGGGRMLALLDPTTGRRDDGTVEFTPLGIEAMLEKYGIRVGMDMVLHPRDELMIVCKDYTWHDIVKSFKNTEYPVYLYDARMASYGTAKDKSVQTSGLMHSLKDAWAEEDAESLYGEAGPKYDPGQDTGGPITMGSAAWQEGQGGMRLVVIGDAHFPSATRYATNQNLFENCINWLSDRVELISIAPRTIQRVQINATTVERNVVFYITILGIPLLVVIAGAAVFFLRRR